MAAIETAVCEPDDRGGVVDMEVEAEVIAARFGLLQMDVQATHGPSVTPLSLLQTEDSVAHKGASGIDRVISKLDRNCSWTIHFDTWLPSFAQGEFDKAFEHSDRLGGVHCLNHCCQDPSCKGLAMESDFVNQCYRYTTVPGGLTQGEPLASFLTAPQPKVRKWSVLVKTPQQPQEAASVKDWLREGHLDRGLAAVSAPGGEAASVVAEARAAGSWMSHVKSMLANMTGSCDWSIHYDTWMPSFGSGEFDTAYEHSDEMGGVHCLRACCADPTCTGLALESHFKYQCYKYSQRPSELQGDGQQLNAFLEHYSIPKWSIFMKFPRPALQPSVLPAPRPALQQAPRARTPTKDSMKFVGCIRWAAVADAGSWWGDIYGVDRCMALAQSKSEYFFGVNQGGRFCKLFQYHPDTSGADCQQNADNSGRYQGSQANMAIYRIQAETPVLGATSPSLQMARQDAVLHESLIASEPYQVPNANVPFAIRFGDGSWYDSFTMQVLGAGAFVFVIVRFHQTISISRLKAIGLFGAEGKPILSTNGIEVLAKT